MTFWLTSRLQAKGIRQEAIQTNIFSAVLSGLRGLAEAKATFGDDNVKNSATQLILVRRGSVRWGRRDWRCRGTSGAVHSHVARTAHTTRLDVRGPRSLQ